MNWTEIIFWAVWAVGLGGYATARARGEKNPARWWMYAVSIGASALLAVLTAILAATKIEGVI